METEYENINTTKITENDLLNNGNNNADNRLDNIAVNDVLTDNNVVFDNPVLLVEQLKIIDLLEPIFKSNYEKTKLKTLTTEFMRLMLIKQYRMMFFTSN